MKKSELWSFFVNLVNDPNHADASLEEMRANMSLVLPIGLDIEPVPFGSTMYELNGTPALAKRNSD